MKYRVTTHSVDARVENAKLPQYSRNIIVVESDSPYEAMQEATKQNFDGCGFHTEGKFGDGSQYGQVINKGNLYGRIAIYAEEVE